VSDRHRDWPVSLRIAPDAFLAPGAIVVGEVEVGARSSLWFHTVVRGDSERIAIGADSNIQDNSVVHVDEGMPAIVGDRVTVGHRAIVHGCVIEEDVLVGMGAVVLSGARVGAGSLIGASALVKEGQVIPPGSLVLGAPARVIGEVRDAHREAIRAGARHYVELSRTYLQRGIGSTVAPTSRAAAAYARELRPMDHMEWEQRLDVLRAGPALAAEALARRGAAACREPAGPGRWCALEVFAHLRDCDREVLLPRLERVLVEDLPAVPDVAVEGWAAERRWADEDPAATIEGWREVRSEALRVLARLGPAEWQRGLVHARRGPMTLSEVVRYWTDHDLAHRRQWREALGERA
jgi:carbonic anhydrase/acetyltransferase-like protein (isoleucine patch superfamily)